MGPISRVSVISTYDALAEVPVLGTISSAVRLSQNILKIVYNVLKSPFTKDKTNLRDNIRFAKMEISLSLREIVPLIGNIYAYKLNKKADLLVNDKSLDGFNVKQLDVLLNNPVSPFYNIFVVHRYNIEVEKKLKKKLYEEEKLLKEIEGIRNVIIFMKNNKKKQENIDEAEQLIKETKDDIDNIKKMLGTYTEIHSK